MHQPIERAKCCPPNRYLSVRRLSENQNRDRALLQSSARRRRNSPSSYYVSRQSFGDEENIEPLNSRNNNNNNNTSTNNNLLSGFSPILLQDSSPTSGTLPLIKREIRLLEEEGRRSTEDEVALASSSPYSGEILIESPETGRLLPLRLAEHEAASAQLVYVATGPEGLPAYYKHEPEAGATAEFMDVASWWEQEQGRLVHQLQAHHHGQHQPAQHQQLAAQQRLAHV